jgi:hypothetical protein
VTTVEIHVDENVAAEDEAALVSCLSALGLAPSAPVRVQPPVRADVVWQVLVTLPVTGFLTAIGTKLGTDAYQQLVVAARRLFSRRPEPMVLRDLETGVAVVIERDLPDAAYLQLPTLDLSACRGTVRYDRDAGRWRDTPG